MCGSRSILLEFSVIVKSDRDGDQVAVYGCTAADDGSDHCPLYDEGHAMLVISFLPTAIEFMALVSYCLPMSYPSDLR